jgi:hypothetical protein
MDGMTPLQKSLLCFMFLFFMYYQANRIDWNEMSESMRYLLVLGIAVFSYFLANMRV